MRRLIDPTATAEDAIRATEGRLTQRDLMERDEQAIRFDPGRRGQRIIVQETIDWYRANVGASGAASYNMRVIDPIGDTTFEMTTTAALYVPAQARVLLARLHSNAAVTGGTAQAEVRVVEDGVTTDYALEECELNTTNTTTIAVRFSWEIGLQIASGATIQLRAKSDASFAPTTADLWGRLVLGYEDWVPS